MIGWKTNCGFDSAEVCQQEETAAALHSKFEKATALLTQHVVSTDALNIAKNMLVEILHTLRSSDIVQDSELKHSVLRSLFNISKSEENCDNALEYAFQLLESFPDDISTHEDMISLCISRNKIWLARAILHSKVMQQNIAKEKLLALQHAIDAQELASPPRIRPLLPSVSVVELDSSSLCEQARFFLQMSISSQVPDFIQVIVPPLMMPQMMQDTSKISSKPHIERPTRRRRDANYSSFEEHSPADAIRQSVQAFVSLLYARYDLAEHISIQNSPLRSRAKRNFVHSLPSCPVCCAGALSMTEPQSSELVLKQHIRAISRSVDTSSGCCIDHVCVCALSAVAAGLRLYAHYNNNVSQFLSQFSISEILFLSECLLDVLIEEPNKQFLSDDVSSFVQYLRKFKDTLRHILLFVCEGKVWLRCSCADDSYRWTWFTIHFSHYISPIDDGKTDVLEALKELRMQLRSSNCALHLPHVAFSSGGGNVICADSADALLTLWTNDIWRVYARRFSTSDKTNWMQWVADMLKILAVDDSHLVSCQELYRIQHHSDPEMTLELLKSRYKDYLSGDIAYLAGVSETLVLASTAIDCDDVDSWAKTMRVIFPVISRPTHHDDMTVHENYLRAIIAQHVTVCGLTQSASQETIARSLEVTVGDVLYRLVDLIQRGEATQTYISLLMEYITAVCASHASCLDATLVVHWITHCVDHLLSVKDSALYHEVLQSLLKIVLQLPLLLVGDTCDTCVVFRKLLAKCIDILDANLPQFDLELHRTTGYFALQVIVRQVYSVYTQIATDIVDETMLGVVLGVVKECYVIISTSALFVLDNGKFSLYLLECFSEYISLKDVKYDDGTLTRVPQLNDDTSILRLITVLGQLYYDVYAFRVCASQCANKELSLSLHVDSSHAMEMYSFVKACDFDIGVPIINIREALNMLYYQTNLRSPHPQNMHHLKKYLWGQENDIAAVISQMVHLLCVENAEELSMKREFYNDLFSTMLIVEPPATIPMEGLTEFAAFLKYLTVTIPEEAKPLGEINLLLTWITFCPNDLQLWCRLLDCLWCLCGVVTRELVNELHPIAELPVNWDVSDFKHLHYHIISGSLKDVVEEYVVAMDKSVVLESIDQCLMDNEAARRGKDTHIKFVNQFTDVLPTVKLTGVAISSLLSKISVIGTTADRVICAINTLKEQGATCDVHDVFASLESSVLGFYSLSLLSSNQSSHSINALQRALDCAVKGFNEFIITDLTKPSDQFLLCYMSAVLSWQLHRDATAALKFMRRAYDAVMRAVTVERLDKRFRAAIVASFHAIRLEVAVELLSGESVVVTDDLRESLETNHELLDACSVCLCAANICTCSGWIWGVVSDAIVRLTVCRQWDAYDVRSTLAYCAFTVAMYEYRITIPEAVQSHLTTQVNTTISTSVALDEMYKVFNKRRPQIAGIWTYETSIKFDKFLDTAEFNRLRDECIDLYWKLLHICQDIPKGLEMLQLCVTANNKRYVNAAVAWALHKSAVEFCILIRSVTISSEQKLSVLTDILNIFSQMGSKQFALTKLKLQSACVLLYAEVVSDSSEVTFDDVHKWYKHETSLVGLKRSSSPVDDFLKATQGNGVRVDNTLHEDNVI